MAKSRRVATAFLLTLMTSACATGQYTPLVGADRDEVEQLKENVYRVEYRVSSFTSQEQLEAYLRRRCAELTLREGYDFLHLADGRLGLVIGDVTDKGVPAALVMAATRSIVRAAAQRLENPGEVLARVNDLLYPDIPPKMFATCMFAILDPVSADRIDQAGVRDGQQPRTRRALPRLVPVA